VAVYQWQGIDAKGKNVKGIRDADNPRLLRTTLRREGVLATAIEEETVARTKQAKDIDLKKFFQRVSTADVAILTRQLATLLRSGVPLVEALAALLDQIENPILGHALTQVRNRVNEGSSLADAMRQHGNIFESIYVNMVAAGETSGTLDTVLERLADYLDSRAQLNSTVMSALAYPAFMMLFGVAVITLMMVVVVPKVTAIFDDFGKALPWYTQMLIFISDAIVNFWWLLFLGVGGAIYAFRRWRATVEGRAAFDRQLLGLPLIGKLVTMIGVARFARTLATLLSSGVPVLNALDITRNVLGNVELMRVVEEAQSAIREGESIASTLQKSGRFPPIVTHMIAIGERTGELEQMLEHVARAYDNQVQVRLRAMTSLLEPIMIVVMGGMAGGIAMAILLPLMQINDFVQ
jgi:general secretion pathway protein F